MINDKDNLYDKFTQDSRHEVCTSALAIWEALSCISEKEMMEKAVNIVAVLRNVKIMDFKGLGQPVQVQNDKRRNQLRDLIQREYGKR